MRSHYFSGNRHNCFERTIRFFFLQILLTLQLHSIYPEGKLFSYVFFARIFFFFVSVIVRFIAYSVDVWSRAFRKWSTRSAGTLLVIYSLFTYNWDSSPVEKLNMWSRCNYSELWCVVYVGYAAMFVFFEMKSILLIFFFLDFCLFRMDSRKHHLFSLSYLLSFFSFENVYK